MGKQRRVAWIAVILVWALFLSLMVTQAPLAKTYKWKIGHANAALDNSALHVTAMIFKELVEKYSNGQIQAEIYPSGQLGSDAEMAD